ncbi:hypothetical protein Krodi_1700 [Dokdonia sp. 4H-3-7-5]|nr:hypothetical protein Krodi_1700 [Dokdonia sp. 4H-3-7-5]
MNYRYVLDGSSKKYVCPKCSKKSFVRYLDKQDGGYLTSTLGRCDRESKCGYFNKPYANSVLSYDVIHRPVPQVPTYHNDDLLFKYCNNYASNNLFNYLLKYFNLGQVLEVFKRYHIGTCSYWKGATVFFQMDIEKRLRGGKVMQYIEHTGKRVKKPYNRISWMHKVLQLDNFILQQCLFGLHNIIDCNTLSTVCITESEKTAIVMSLMFPEYTWLATGSKSNFKESLLQPLKAYNIIAYPDKTEFNDWNNKCKDLNRQGYHINCSDLLESQALEEGGDLVDLVVSKKFL